MAENIMTRIAFLGLGAMGARMAANLLDAGFALAVWNRDIAKAEALAGKGALVGASPRAAAMGADIVFSMLRDDEASHRVWLDPATGAFSAMKPEAIAVECSTLSVAFVRRLGAEARRRDLRFLDAPVAGSRPQAEARQLIHFVGGEAETLARAEPALKAMSAAVHHAGEVGAGAALKLAVNALFGVQVAAMAEIIGMLEKQGVAADRAIAIIGATPTASPAAKAAAASMLAGDYAPLFPVELVAKDFDYVVDSASGAGAPMAEAARAVFQTALAAGFGDEHLTSVRRLY
ncbi:MAG: NAD(P)-dependent oxidoreductase [Parvularculaceae bacterium]|nr:NAD(P)-dependent oxidoreductase [Parvularculaceae bacterium]